MKKVVIFCPSYKHFSAHLLPIALSAKSSGYEVAVITSLDGIKEPAKNLGLKILPLKINRGSMNIFLEIKTLFNLIRIIRFEKPDIIHNFAVKPILYGSIASLFLSKNVKVINTFLGMGYLFINQNPLSVTLRFFISKILSLIAKFRKIQFVTQNLDDANLISSIIKKARPIVLCSVGIDPSEFSSLKEPKGPVIFALVARILKDKGIYEFAEAAEILKKQNIEADFWLVGEPDPQNKSSLTERELKKIESEGYVKYLGYEKNVKKIWEKASVAVLPSYREGLSRSLLEAAAFGRAIITTDAPGGRDLIRNGENGLSVKPKDSKELAEAMKKFALDAAFRKKMARRIRKEALEKYDSRELAYKTVKLYE